MAYEQVRVIVLAILEMASVDATDFVAKAIAEAIKDNKTLEILNVESNFISGESIVWKSLKTLTAKGRSKNYDQKSEILGNQVEMAITKLIEANDTLLRFGIWFEYPDSRVRVQEKIQKNNDQKRQARKTTKDDAGATAS